MHKTTIALEILCFLTFSSMSSKAADLTLVALDPTGKQMSGCQVRKFVAWQKEPKGRRQEYQTHFQGFQARDIPNGEYSAQIYCGTIELFKLVTVDTTHRFLVFVDTARHLIGHPNRPTLTIKLPELPPKNETWWIQLVPLYLRESHLDRFSADTGVAEFWDPEPGIYQVTVLSTTGYACTREIEFDESTSQWAFHPRGCTFDFDRFAHLVRRDTDYKRIPDTWHRDMQAHWDEFHRASDKAAAEETRQEINHAK